MTYTILWQLAIGYMLVGLVVMPIAAVRTEMQRLHCSVFKGFWEAYVVAARDIIQNVSGGKRAKAWLFGSLAVCIIFVLSHLVFWLPMTWSERRSP